jgi:hypothetical protein
MGVGSNLRSSKIKLNVSWMVDLHVSGRMIEKTRRHRISMIFSFFRAHARMRLCFFFFLTETCCHNFGHANYVTLIKSRFVTELHVSDVDAWYCVAV